MPFPRKGGNVENDTVAVSSTLASTYRRESLANPGTPTDTSIRRASLGLPSTHLDLDSVQHSSTPGGGNDVITPTTEENRMDACIRRASLRLLETNLDLDSVRNSSTPGGGNGDVAEEKTESQVPVGTDDSFDENHRQSP